MNTRNLGRLAYALLGVALFCLTPLTARAQQPYDLGLSISSNGYNERCWTDMFKSDARTWKPGTTDGVSTDASGYPTADFDLYSLDGGYARDNAKMLPLNGTYRLYFNGQATVTLSGASLQNLQYDAANNLTTADVIATDQYPTFFFTFRNTKRTANSATNTGLTGLKLMRPTAIGGTTPYAQDTVFTSDYLAAHNRGNVLRSMDFVSTNGNIQTNWSDRSLPDILCYNVNPGGYGWQGRGAPWERFILLCNTLNKDAWVNVPLYASDDYILQLATLLKNTLNPNLKIYVEYSNEIWNFGFVQFGQVRDLATAEVNRGGSNLNYDGSTSASDWTIRYWVRRCKEQSDIFRSVFGDAAMMTRVRPLFETQQSWDAWIAGGMLFLDNYYNNNAGNFVANPHPVNYYLWGGGGSAYNEAIDNSYAYSDTLTVDDLFNLAYPQSWTGFYNTQARNVQWTSAFGLKRVAYESGPGLDGNGHSDAAKSAAQTDPRIKAVYKRQVDEFYKSGGDLWIHFLGVNITHGLLPYDSVVGNQVTYKQQAFDELMATPSRPVPTFGFAVPGTINAGRYHICYDGYSTGNSDNPVTLNPTNWFSYTINVGAAGTYSVQLTPGFGNGTAKVEVDGNVVGTVSFPSGGSVNAGSLGAGIHAIRIVNGGGAPSVQSLVVTSGGGQPQTAAPTFSPGGGTYSSAQSVTISTTTSGASIRYTTDGSNPTSSSGSVYSGPVSVGSSLTLKAIAYKSGNTDSSVSSASYTINAPGTTLPLRINAGGGAISPFLADQYGNGGYTASWSNAVDTSAANAAPQGVYQSERYGDMTYTIPGLTAGTSYTVRLHFAENWFGSGNPGGGGTGSRLFNVAINGASVLSNYDVLADAGAPRKAVVKDFTATANSSGQIVIAFTNGSANNALINGIEILASSGGGGGGGGGTNLLVNPGFETGQLSGWFGGGANGVNSAAPRSGSYNGYANGVWSSLTQTVSALQPNTSYTFTIYARLTTNDTTNPVVIFVRNYGGATVQKNITTTGYQAYSITFTTGASATSAEVGVDCLTGAAVGAYCDDGSFTAN